MTKEIFETIWSRALIYQDQRDDQGHAETTLYYARRLIRLENGDEDVVVPAIILHDIGWSQLPRPHRFIIYNENAAAEEKYSVRLRHQNKGVALARQVLNEVNYPAALTAEVLTIISEHDTREGFISLNEGLVRDADKLWRFSATGFATDTVRYKLTPAGLSKKLAADMRKPNYFYSASARRIASEELEIRRGRKRG